MAAAKEPTAAIGPLRVEPGTGAGLGQRDPADRLGFVDKKEGRAALEPLLAELDALHDRLWAEATRSVLLVLQGMDTAGKDGAIRKVLTSIDPQGLRVSPFKLPSDEERAHDYLWRIHAQCPPRGHLGVFNRSHYESVVAALLGGDVDQEQCERRYRHLREFERMLVDEGTYPVKVFLHISLEEQRERLQARLDDPEKRWKFRKGDLAVRERWDEYQAAYERAITETSTEWAPWYVVPADHKWVRDVAVARILVASVRALDPRFPPPAPELDGVVVS
ncbi:MAG TPA: PPK2 family polyphosphate kinase [Acidimicrobiia bacterium]|nr:PPK2 family polyphosphate kinase [Acidimicrobiia bacterium]